jgi:hypothetical protein
MAEKKRSSDGALRENPLVAQLIAQGAETAMTLRGFVGSSAREGYVRLYPRLQNLSDSIEIARADILHSMEAPQSVLGGVILWVKKDAKIAVTRVGVSEPAGTPAENLVDLRKGPAGTPPENLVELRKGRLRMRVRPQQAHAVCFSHCMDCISWCSCLVHPCTSHCHPT